MPESPLQELIAEQIADLYDAEKQLTKALPRMAKAARDEELSQGFRKHLEETQGHVQRLEQIFEQMGKKARGKPCQAMKGLVAEGAEVMSGELEGAVRDLALIAAARRVEHYEMAAYESLAAVAKAVRNSAMEQLLNQTLAEESATDKVLSGAAKRLLKDAARAVSAEEPEPGPKGRQQGTKKSSGQKASPKKAGEKPTSKAGGAKKSGTRATGAQDDSGHLSHTSTDHDEIRQWAEQRGGKPACVRGTGGKGDIGLMRIEFPGKPHANDSKLEEISWEDFFEKFDERALALVYQEETADGETSNFNKLIAREPEAKPKAKSAR